MIGDYITEQIRREFPYEPTREQDELIAGLGDFVAREGGRQAFLLKGYAGTGKTSIVSALVRAMERLQLKFVLLAPTGRAAKVMAAYSGFSASSIHKKIYRQDSITSGHFSIGFNTHKHTLFVVDEASMVYNVGDGTFGTGDLLSDLISFVYSDSSNRLLLLGDEAQLPPVNQEDSPSLQRVNLEGYGLNVEESCLKEVTRQATDSGILANATHLRKELEASRTFKEPHLQAEGFADVKMITGGDLIETLNNEYDAVGVENVMVVTRSNKTANIYNGGIRSRVLQVEDQLISGDRLMVTRNNYYWSKMYGKENFIANGDMCEVIRIHHHQELYGLHWADAILSFPDYEYEFEAKILMESLFTEKNEDARRLYEQMRNTILEDYADLPSKEEQYKALRENPYYNALQIKFAYAVTCHKAQGGQWDVVFVEHGYMPEGNIDKNYYRWLYTAVTRAKQRLYLVNFSKE